MNIKTILIVLSSFFFMGQSQLNAQVEARLHQVIEVKNAQKIALDLQGNHNKINIKETYSTVLIVEMVITLEKGGPAQIEQLIKTGRYEVDYTIKDGVVTIRRRYANPTPIVVDDVEVSEYITYNISVPEYIEY